MEKIIKNRSAIKNITRNLRISLLYYRFKKVLELDCEQKEDYWFYCIDNDNVDRFFYLSTKCK